MEAREYLLQMELGALQSFENMAVFPLRFPGNGGPEYITLKEALERGVFIVSEVSAGGSVPELMVENKGDVAVLILDGEELAGAKQNRVLNTTIIVGPKSAAKIPVSCTEQGRWSYVSNHFQESGHHLAPNLRLVNIRNVNLSLRSGREFHGDQGAIWDGIDRMAVETDVRSTTRAMRDVFEAKQTVLEDYLKSFGLQSGQQGAIVLVGGEVAGLDFVSREQAYGMLHAKLIKSYAMEAMLAGEREKAGKRGKKRGVKEKKEEKPDKGGQEEAKAREFLGKAGDCAETRYQSVGLGASLRYEGGGIIGSALAVEERIIHMAFFRASGSAGDRVEDMAAFSSRRRFRTE